MDTLVVAHWSLLELASIKASDDEIRCWHGNVEKLPHSWGTYDAVFLGHSPAMAFSASALFESVTSRCRVGKSLQFNLNFGLSKLLLKPFENDCLEGSCCGKWKWSEGDFL